MFTETQLSVIKTFGRKDLTEGCVVALHKTRFCKILFSKDGLALISNGLGFERAKISELEILGHIPEVFPDVARVAEEKGWIIKIEYNYFKNEYVGITIDNSLEIYSFIPYNPTLPLLDQPESTLKELLALFK